MISKNGTYIYRSPVPVVASVSPVVVAAQDDTPFDLGNFDEQQQLQGFPEKLRLQSCLVIAFKSSWIRVFILPEV